MGFLSKIKSVFSKKDETEQAAELNTAITIGEANYKDDELKKAYASLDHVQEEDAIKHKDHLRNASVAKFYDLSTGSEICSISNLTTHDFEYYPSNNRLANFSGFGSATFTLEDASFNTEALRNLIRTSEDAEYVLTGMNPRLKRLKYIAKRTKNKRIKKKVTKQITKMDHPIFNQGMKLKASNMSFELVRNYRDYTK